MGEDRAELESAGAGPEHLPYRQLWAVDDRATRYRTLLVGEGGTATWLGTIQLTPAPPPAGPDRRRDAPAPPAGPDWFAPLGVILPDADGTRFALAGLTFAGGESDLHVVASGGPDPGFSWWVRDDAGSWHVARETGRSEVSPGLAGGSGWEVGWLRLTPPLRGCPEAIEVVVTGPATRVRAVVPVREGFAMADT